jgi:hypothetical protein
VSGMGQINNREFTIANVNTTANTFELVGVNSTAYSAYISGGEVVEVPPTNGEKDGLAYSSAIGYQADVYIQNCVIKGIRGRNGTGPVHGDCIQRYGPAGTLNLYNVHMESTYQAFFLRPQAGYELNALNMRNVSVKWTAFEQPWQPAMYFFSNLDTAYLYDTTLTNVYLNEDTPFAPEWRFVWPNSTDNSPYVATRSGDATTWAAGDRITWSAESRITGYVQLGLPSTPVVNESAIGIGYQHGDGPY